MASVNPIVRHDNYDMTEVLLTVTLCKLVGLYQRLWAELYQYLALLSVLWIKVWWINVWNVDNVDVTENSQKKAFTQHYF